MSTSSEPDFDLEKLFLPAWAQDAPQTNRYANFQGEERSERKFDDRPGRRPQRREGQGGPRREGQGGPRPAGGRPQPRGGFAGPGGDRRGGRPDDRRQDRSAPREEAPLPPPVTVSILPEEKGVESLARQIRVTGRAYPLFDIARLILQKPERQQVRFDVKKDAEGKIIQLMYLCAVDESLWLSEEEAVNHVLGRHFQMFYQPERTATEPPKGTYTFVAQCGMSGKVLGPPNYHDYQSQLHKLHSERFSNMPFEVYKARVKIVRDEAVVKQWIEDHSFKTEYNCLNVPEPKKLANRDEVNAHFRSVHLPNIIKPVETCMMGGAAAKQVRSQGLQRAVRIAWEEQRRFPLQLATVLSQQFAGFGLQFFKVNKTVTHVSVARPRYLDMEASPVSEGVKRIVEFINSTAKATRKKLLETLAPAPAPAAAAAPAPAPAPAETAPGAEGAAPAAPAAPVAPAQPAATPEQTALASDLHWLIHEGHVIEYANGILETAKKPAPRPPKPEKPASAKPAPAPGGEAASSAGAAAAAPSAEQAAAPAETPAEGATDSPGENMIDGPMEAPAENPAPAETPAPVA